MWPSLCSASSGFSRRLKHRTETDLSALLEMGHAVQFFLQEVLFADVLGHRHGAFELVASLSETAEFHQQVSANAG